MPPEHARDFGGGAAATSLNPIVMVALLLAVVAILVLPRVRVIIPVLMMLLIPIGSVIVIGSVHLYVFRLVIITALCRLLYSRATTHEQVFAGGRNAIDNAFLSWATLHFIANVLLFRDSAAVVNQVGVQFIDFLGAYVMLRFLIRDESDVVRSVKCFAVIALIVSIGMIGEQRTQSNAFSAIGGAEHPDVRNGAIRSQGPFRHSLTAGAFAASSLCLFFMLWKSGRRNKLIAAIGIAAATAMTVCAHSSGPVLAFGAGIIGALLWPLRDHMRELRWGIVAVVSGLALVMKSPVWFLIARIDLTGSSTSFQRAMLVDTFVRHFAEWWLMGVKDSGGWGWDMWDTQNQFVSIGVTAGLLPFILFVSIFVRAYARVGTAGKAARSDGQQRRRLWLLGCALFATNVAFFGVNYFDQSKMIWIAIVAMSSAAATIPCAVKGQEIAQGLPGQDSPAELATSL